MNSLKEKTVLVSGASIAGLSTAYWMNRIGYKVTVVEIAGAPRTAGAAVDIKGAAVEIARRMGIYEEMKSQRLSVEKMEFKNADDITEGSIILRNEGDEHPNDEIEIERDKFFNIIYERLENEVEFIFNDRVIAMAEAGDEMNVSFQNGPQRAFSLVIGCDGIHSGVRKVWFGEEKKYAHFLKAYSCITIVNKLLVKQNTMQAYNVPGKAFMLNAYNGKTDIIFCFSSENEIEYDYRDAEQQRKIILERFGDEGWRTAELLEEVQQSKNFYFDKFCQIKMPSWTKGRVALTGDAAYCASPAAGMGASLSMEGAAALADALQKHPGDIESAFLDYNKNFRPFIEEVQATAEMNLTHFIPATEEAIRERNRMEEFL